MRRPLAHRLVTALWGLWFAVVLVEPAAMPACPTHGNHTGHAMEMPSRSTHAAGRLDLASHHGIPEHSSPAPCTCLGACCCAPAFSAPIHAVAELPATTLIVVPAFVPPSADEAPALARAYSHPFANGPPTPRSA